MSLPLPLPLPLCNLPDWLINSILGFDDGACFKDQPQQTIDHYQLLDHSSINQETYSSTSGVIPQSMACYESLASELEKQRPEMDWLLQLENHRLRTAVQEMTRQQAVLLQRYECKIVNLVRKKDRDMEAARNRNMGLQNLLVTAEAEAQAWQKKAMDNEAIVINLNNRLDQVIREGKFSISSAAHDVESFCESSSIKCINQEDQQLKKIACKRCEARSLCVVFFPCRHLCSCTTCESLLAVCPICESVKEGSLEVFWD